jgi:3-hydroxybutyryl-CoA dehydrogenase
VKLKRVGVIGVGVIGVGVVQDLAQNSHNVLAIDIDGAVLERAQHDLRRRIRVHHLTAGTGQPLSVADVLGHISFTTDLNLLKDRQFIIENVTEDWDAKRHVYEQIDRISDPSCVFAANTSVIPITKIAAATSRASRVIGMHFMNPVPLKPAVEVIRGYHTSDETVETATQLLSQMNKSAILVNDSPGFVSNRVLMLTINEAAFVLYEGVATAQKVDAIFKECFGHAMGPLETADLIGVDTILRSIEMLRSEFEDSKYRPCPLLKTMVNAGELGRKSGKGFYSYQRPQTNGPGDAHGRE